MFAYCLGLPGIRFLTLNKFWLEMIHIWIAKNIFRFSPIYGNPTEYWYSNVFFWINFNPRDIHWWNRIMCSDIKSGLMKLLCMKFKYQIDVRMGEIWIWVRNNLYPNRWVSENWKTNSINLFSNFLLENLIFKEAYSKIYLWFATIFSKIIIDNGIVLKLNIILI